MLVKIYRVLKARLDRLRERHAAHTISNPRYYLSYSGYRVLIQLIISPHFLLLGPFKTFTAFARKDEHGSWIDSYNDFVVSNRVTVTGIIALALIGIVTILVFVYLPIIYI
ncbi:MAG: hypothetical protein U0517_02770 [Candidatus Andersenbacteria bacterium]